MTGIRPPERNDPGPASTNNAVPQGTALLWVQLPGGVTSRGGQSAQKAGCIRRLRSPIWFSSTTSAEC